MATKKKSSTTKKLSQEQIKEKITGIKEPGRRNKQENIQAEISGDVDNAISADEVRPASSEKSQPSRKHRRASS